MRNKKVLREHFSALRKNCSYAQNNAIWDNLMKTPEYKNSECIFTYISVKSEPDTKRFIEESLKLQKTICVPKCNIKDRSMKFIKITSVEKELASGNYNIPEPLSSEEYKGKPDIVIVPALSCDLQGNRLGYGGGYYDRYLALNKSGVLITALYDCLVTDALPYEDTDIPMDIIITESRILRLK